MSLALIHQITALDDRTLIWLNQFMYRWPLFDAAVAWMLDANIIKFVPMLLVVCWLWFDRKPKQIFTRQILVESILISIGALFVGRAFALALPFRDRPFLRPELHFITPLEPVLRSWSSFPSDNAVLAFALAASIFRLSPRLGIWAFFHAIVFISLPRLYFGLHHPSDLLGGAVIGIVLVIAASQLQARHAIANFILDIERNHTGMFYAASFFVLYNIAQMFYSFRMIAYYVFQFLRQHMGQ